MTIAERLLTRLREIGLDLPEGSRLARTNASAASRNEGAWSWFAQGPDGRDLRIGSQFPMGKLLKAQAIAAETLRAGYGGKDTDILPARLCVRCSTPTPDVPCRLCRVVLCRTCFMDHHHEGNGTPLTDTR